MTSDDAARFFRSWLSDPLRVGAVAPSGASLAKLITAEISPSTSPVIELGPGTGVFTRALVASGVPASRLALVEYGSDFVRILQVRFPEAHVIWMDATQLRNLDLFGRSCAGAVVSGLPLLGMRARKVMAILEGAFIHLRADGALYQFTYLPRCPIPRPILDRLSLKAVRIGATVANLPPAAVYRITRRRPRPAWPM